MKIRVENVYADGHESEREQRVTEYAGDPHDRDALSDHLFEFTGDGHGAAYPSLGCYHTVTILESAHPVLVGVSMDWDG